MNQNPCDAVFSTIGWDGDKKILLPDLHFNRIKEHCYRLSITYPDDIEQKFLEAFNLEPKLNSSTDKFHSSQPPFLLKINLSSSGLVSVKGRKNTPHNGTLIATVNDAPRWDKNITGTKHAAWDKYNQITESSQKKGFDIALLTFEDTIIDGDRCTPILLDHDGTAWVSDKRMGGVDSITLDYLIEILQEQGIPVLKGRLTANMILRSQELLVLGTGIGVAQIVEVDGVNIGKRGNSLYKICSKYLTELQTDKWTELKGD